MANRKLEDFLVDQFTKGPAARKVLQAALVRFPDIGAAVGASTGHTEVSGRLRAEKEAVDDDLAFVQRVQAIGERVGWPDNPHWKLPEMLRHAAVGGDAEAAALLARMQG